MTLETEWTNAEVWGFLRFSRCWRDVPELQIADVERVARKVLKVVGPKLERLHVNFDPDPLSFAELGKTVSVAPFGYLTHVLTFD